MKTETFNLNERILSQFAPLPEDWQLEEGVNYLFDLSWMSLLTVQGDNAASFLQGQLTCDLNEVTPSTYRPGAYCNLQGRVLALVDVLLAQNYQLILPKDLLESTQNALSKAALFSQVKLAENQSLGLMGYYQQNPQAPGLPLSPDQSQAHQVIALEDQWLYALGEGLYILIAPHEKLKDYQSKFSAANCWRSALAWQRLNLSLGRFQIYPKTRGLFLPQRLGLEGSAYLSFNKGCYKGQEIIARMYYRSKAKHELKRFILDQEIVSAGQKLLTIERNRELGEIIDCCPLGNQQTMILASILIDRPESFVLE